MKPDLVYPGKRWTNGLVVVLLVFLLSGCISGSTLPASTNQPVNDPAPIESANPVKSFAPQPVDATPTSTSLSTVEPSPTVTSIPTSIPTATSVTRTTLLFTGVIVPARCVQAAIDARGSVDYIYEEVREVITAADLAIGTLNATLSDYPIHTGCVFTYLLVGSPDNADAMADAGFDVMSVATNHIKNCGLANCGDRAFFDTLANLQRVGILPVGAGANHAQAMLPVVVEINGIKFGFVSLGQIETMAFAGEQTPGIAVLTPENLKKAIEMARAVSDVVIAMPHWGPEDVPVPNWIQRGLARQAVEFGADVVVGNHTHVVQAIQEINGVPVFYGLGNFVFDQSLRDHKQGVILLVHFEGARYTGFDLVPTHVDQDGTVHLAGPEEAQEILERIEQASRSLK